MSNLFGEPLTEPVILRRRPDGKPKRKPTPARGYAASPGTGPEGETCGSCRHLVRLRYSAADDGVTQTVTAKQGVAFVQEVAVPNPVTLAPYRSFPEISQVESEFVLRVRAGRSEGELPTIALFEADGGRWQLEAVRRVKDYLKQRVGGIPVIA